MARDAIIEDDRGDVLAESDDLRSSLLSFTGSCQDGNRENRVERVLQFHNSIWAH